MTAGRGIVHSEMPEQEEGRMAGFQLWVNLPPPDKMTAPAYRDIAPAAVPAYTDAAGRPRARHRRREPRHGRRGDAAEDRADRPRPDLAAGQRASTPSCRRAQRVRLRLRTTPVAIGEGPGASDVEPDRMAILANDEGSDGVRFTVPADASAPARVLLVAGAGRSASRSRSTGRS